jgi:crotonobetainyl-CoA:carnitine CoA-transferase CaiB-like acyl-CoA transferase
LAASLPGSLLRDLGAGVIRVEGPGPASLDSGVEYHRAWNRDKEVIQPDSDAAATVAELARQADVVFLAGPEAAVEAAGIGAHHLIRANPRLVGVRIRPSFNALGSLPDLELLVAARAGVPTQIRGHAPGAPVFPDLAVGQAGAAFSAAVGALAGLYDRERTGAGRWAETSLYDGIQAMLPMILGRVEHHSPSTRLLWEQQGPAESQCYRCADGEYVQLWFGAKGAYEAFLAHIGDPPSDEGYNAEMMSGAMVERGRRWADKFGARDRAWWLDYLAGHDFRCEPVLRPGEALLDPHLRELGLAIDHHDPGRGPITVLGPGVRVMPTGTGTYRAAPDEGPLLSGLRVVDLSAYLAGPVAALALAELGADVVKVEPVAGDVHRHMEPMFAAGQRGKRAIALDLKSTEAVAVLDRLFRWSDVVHHNSRLGLAERLGYDEPTVRAANPEVIYSFASGFGEHGPRANLPVNDQLIQALTGVERAQAGEGQPPRFLTWGAVDVAGGWLAACGILAALYARRRTGSGQVVSSSLLAGGLLLKSGAFVLGSREVVAGGVLDRAGEAAAGPAAEPVLDGAPAVAAGPAVEPVLDPEQRVVAGPVLDPAQRVVAGPVLDRAQHGYGAVYRLYQAGDGRWLALAVPDVAAWDRFRSVVRVTAPGGAGRPEGLPSTPPPLRTSGSAPQPEEEVLEAIFRTEDASTWVDRLRRAGVPVEPVAEVDRTAFTAGFVDDPVNRQLGRVVTYQWGDRGRVDQPTFPPRLGPEPAAGAGAWIASLGAHTAEVLEELGFDAEARAKLAASGAIPG